MQIGLRYFTVIAIAMTIQTTWVAEFTPFGVTGDLMLLFTIAMAMVAGPMRGATAGFIAGLAMDLFLLSPFGLTALAYLTVGYVVGLVLQGVIRSAFWIPLAAAFVASVGGIGFYVILGQLLGQQFRLPNLLTVMLITAIMNTALIFPTISVARWINKAIPDRMMAKQF